MIDTERLLIKPLTDLELRQFIESPGDFAKSLGLIAVQSLIDKETKETIENDLLPYIDNPKKTTFFIPCG